MICKKCGIKIYGRILCSCGNVLVSSSGKSMGGIRRSNKSFIKCTSCKVMWESTYVYGCRKHNETIQLEEIR